MDVFWLNVVLYLIGEDDIEATSRAVGAVIQLKARGEHRMGVWCRWGDGSDPVLASDLSRVGAEIRRSLEGHEDAAGAAKRGGGLFGHIGYELHKQSKNKPRGSHNFIMLA